MYLASQKRIAVIIEARMHSTRLPGKVLLPLAGRPALERLIERVKRSRYIDTVIVATTEHRDDDPIAMLATQLGVSVFRGSENDVLDRVLSAARFFNVDIIVEITGDCPLMDPELIDRGVTAFFEHEVDYASNILKRSYPDGFDVQVFSTAVLSDVASRTNDPIDRVHVSWYIYHHPRRYRLLNWVAPPDCTAPELRLTLDERSDYELLNTIFERLLPHREHFSVMDVMKIIRNEPQLLDINRHVQTKDPLKG